MGEKRPREAGEELVWWYRPETTVAAGMQGGAGGRVLRVEKVPPVDCCRNLF